MQNLPITARIPHQSAARTSLADSFPPGEALHCGVQGPIFTAYIVTHSKFFVNRYFPFSRGIYRFFAEPKRGGNFFGFLIDFQPFIV